VKLGSLFAGIGGFDLAARWMGWTTSWFSEIDPYASAVLQKHWPGVPNLGDICKIEWQASHKVDLLCGGFPCQDISKAGNGKGLAGDRSGLWSEFVRAILALRPRWVVIENVPTLLGRGFAVVRRDLRAVGYRVARPVRMSASAVDAPHTRERLWIVAHAHAERRRELHSVARLFQGSDIRRDHWRVGGDQTWRGDPAGLLWTTEPEVGRVADGIPTRLGELRGLGNAIVPQCALVIFQAIQEAEERLAA
jgi:DNA (cytosine-5)-methyltransferase 1